MRAAIGVTRNQSISETEMATGMDHFDLIVIGTGPGGASLAQRLAPTGKRILLLERGDYLPRTRSNWDSKTVFVDGAYQVNETWHDRSGRGFHPGLHYYVGGNSKVYGAALFHMREREFGEVVHKDGLSPAWPLPYHAFEPFYTEAEKLFLVHGKRGEDPGEPPASGPYPFHPVTHEPAVQFLSDRLAEQGLHPFHLPLGIRLDDRDGKVTPTRTCIRCDAFDGFPCLLNGKADAQVMCVDPGPGGQRKPDLTYKRLCYASRDGCHRSHCHSGPCATRGGSCTVFGRRRRRCVWRTFISSLAASITERLASRRLGQRLWPGRP